MARTTASKRTPVNLIDRAATIRNLAGLESGQTAGVASGVTYGLEAGITTVAQADLVINNESVIEAIKSGGDGNSAATAWLVENKAFDGSGAAAIAVNWTQAAPDYHIKFKNCTFTGYTTVVFRASGAGSTGSIEFENCEFDAAAGYIFDPRAAHVLIVDKCHIKQCQGTAAVKPFSGWTGTCTVTDTYFDDTAGAWGANAGAIAVQDIAATSTIDVDRIIVEATTAGQIFFGVRVSDPCRLTVDNALIDGCDFGVTDAVDDNNGGGVFTNCQFQNMVEENVRVRQADSLYFIHCDFRDTPADKRLVFFYSDYIAATSLTQYPTNCHLIRCKGSKTTGTNTVDNEAFEFIDPLNCTMQGCWIDGSVEDALEIVRPQPGCKIIDCVIDNSIGECVDIFNTQDVLTAGGMFVKNIFGENNSDYGVVLTGVSDVTLNNILIDNSDSSVPLCYALTSSARVYLTGYSSELSKIGDGTNALLDDGSGTTITDNSTAYTAITRNAV